MRAALPAVALALLAGCQRERPLSERVVGTYLWRFPAGVSTATLRSDGTIHGTWRTNEPASATEATGSFTLAGDTVVALFRDQTKAGPDSILRDTRRFVLRGDTLYELDPDKQYDAPYVRQR